MPYVYFIQEELSKRIKIGCTQGLPEKRLQQIQTGNSEVLALIGQILTDQPKKLEDDIHASFSHLRIRGEWFAPGAELIRYIRQHREIGDFPSLFEQDIILQQYREGVLVGRHLEEA